MRKFGKCLMVLAISLCLSATGTINTFAEVSSVNEYAIDKQSGYAPYYDQALGLYGYVNSFNNNEIVIPAKYYIANAFFDGKAIVRLSDPVSYNVAENIYALIDGSGNELSRFNIELPEGYNKVILKPRFYYFVRDDAGYVFYYTINLPEVFIFASYKSDGSGIDKYFYDFHAIKLDDGTWSTIVLGDFVNGTANIYAPIQGETVEGDFVLLSKYRAVGSITSNGDFSTIINPDSKFENQYRNAASSTAPDSAYEKLEANN